jgi:hypothetical protein
VRNLNSVLLATFSVAREAALPAAEAIPREIGREVTMMLREVMMVVERNRTTSRDLLEPSNSSSGNAKS